MEHEILRSFLYELVKESPSKLIEEKLQYMENRVADRCRCPEEQRGKLNRSLRYFKSDFKKRWSLSNNIEERFLKKNEQWLGGTVKIPNYASGSSGRPEKDFKSCSERTKRRKTEELRQQSTPEELTYAACMSQRASGNPNAAVMIKKITETPTKASKFKKSLQVLEKSQVFKNSPSKALSMLVDADLTKHQYETIRSFNKNIYPCYSLVKKAKLDCYPKDDSIFVSETLAEVKLQALLDHTALRLCQYLEEVLDSLTLSEQHELELISKWGCDGSQQSQFKQKFSGVGESDANIFQSSLVPLKLIYNKDSTSKVVWQNPTPSSTRFCRPIRIRFVHETVDITKEEIKYVEQQAEHLTKTEVSTQLGVAKIKHKMVFTMVDGKVCNAAMGVTSTMRCYVCGLTSKDFNNLSKVNEINTEALQFGLSILHTRIRFFESLLHLSYKIGLKTWQARTKDDKEKVAQAKNKIQQAFKDEMGLLVDIPKQGFGNTNDGNTSRRFFSDPDTASRITDIDICLIKKLKVILEAISSGHAIDEEKFEKYTREAAELYVKLYPWYPMTPTMHKVLMHGATIIKHAVLPIGQLSEEAAEARNKHFRLYRLHFARKFSREICNRDVLNRLLLTSDPFLSCSRQIARKRSKPFLSETVNLLLPDKLPTHDPTSEEEESDVNITGNSSGEESCEEL